MSERCPAHMTVVPLRWSHPEHNPASLPKVAKHID